MRWQCDLQKIGKWNQQMCLQPGVHWDRDPMRRRVRRERKSLDLLSGTEHLQLLRGSSWLPWSSTLIMSFLFSSTERNCLCLDRELVLPTCCFHLKVNKEPLTDMLSTPASKGLYVMLWYQNWCSYAINEIYNCKYLLVQCPSSRGRLSYIHLMIDCHH